MDRERLYASFGGLYATYDQVWTAKDCAHSFGGLNAKVMGGWTAMCAHPTVPVNYVPERTDCNMCAFFGLWVMLHGPQR